MRLPEAPDRREMTTRRVATWAAADLLGWGVALGIPEAFGGRLPEPVAAIVLAVFLAALAGSTYTAEAGNRLVLWWETRGYDVR